MTYIDKIERDSDRKGAPRADRYYSADVVATIHCKVSSSKRQCQVTALHARWVHCFVFRQKPLKAWFKFNHPTRRVDCTQTIPGCNFVARMFRVSWCHVIRGEVKNAAFATLDYVVVRGKGCLRRRGT